MAVTYTETHFHGRQQAVTELFFHYCLGQGSRYVDVKDLGLGRVTKKPSGLVVAGGRQVQTEGRAEVLLVAPRDRSGWCVAYGSSPALGEKLLDLLGRPCPIEDGERTWEARLGIEAVVHGYLDEEELGWGWVVRRSRERDEFSRKGTLDAPPGKDIVSAFAAAGRLFGQVNLDLVLHRLINVTRPPDLDAHRLLWVDRSRPSTV
jgi:hypothetical protein